MTTKKNDDPIKPAGLGRIKALAARVRGIFFAVRRGPALATLIAFLVSVVVVMHYQEAQGGAAGDLKEFEVGKVAEREVIAEQAVSYIDENATRLKIDAQQHLVPPVFRYVQEVTAEARKEYSRFASLSRQFFAQENAEPQGAEEKNSLTAYIQGISAAFPGFFSPETLDILFHDPQREQVLEAGSRALEHFMEDGIFVLSETDGEFLENYNRDVAELLRSSATRTGRERVDFNRIVTLDTFHEALNRWPGEGFPPGFHAFGFELLKPFIKENVFFSASDTEQRVQELQSLTEPVHKQIEPGTRIIRKGFIITDEDMIKLRALNVAVSQKDPQRIAGQMLLLLLLYCLFIFLGWVRIAGKQGLTPAEIYLLTALTALYVIGAALANNLPFNTEFFPVSIVLPTALVIMLPAILISSRLALVWALALPISAFLSGSFDEAAFILALTSGVVASYTLKRAEKRMDLVKAGLIIACAHGIALLAILLLKRSAGEVYPLVLFWGAFNGLASGMLVLGFLPPLEHALNAATTFRLIELSDLNAPLIKRLFTVAPGTYSHSIMVANLAEAACQEIGANPLLARVGAYYHDIGKMDQPDYFVENQTSYNKHNDIPPRLSATIIRSHVKQGVEKARALGLPREVTNIIAEHHGNSVITWFYNEALKQDPQVSKEDFSYPGNPPRSRESAVVMLADVSEAAVRTLEKPTAAKIEKFLQELIDAKVEHGQLAESELTFRDLQTIKHAFVRVLAGYYHSRIEYPKLPAKEVRKEASHEPD
ncbi:MAG: HDIG domain-containing protein [Treponema sp.]|jgi:putative nucleotidyltransferase with HDIG domain|nr:HDIG domain-containing protein [Treponema sp.]